MYTWIGLFMNGTEFKKQREKLNLSQSQLALKLGISKTQVYRLEHSIFVKPVYFLALKYLNLRSEKTNKKIEIETCYQQEEIKQSIQENVEQLAKPKQSKPIIPLLRSSSASTNSRKKKKKKKK